MGQTASNIGAKVDESSTRNDILYVQFALAIVVAMVILYVVQGFNAADSHATPMHKTREVGDKKRIFKVSVQKMRKKVVFKFDLCEKCSHE